MGRYDVVAIPGGHGPVEDLYKDPDMGRVLEAAEGAGKIIAPVCHGPAALLSAKDANGEWLFKGRKMTAATDQGGDCARHRQECAMAAGNASQGVRR